MSILVIAEHDNNNLKGATLNTVSAATRLTGEVNLLVIGFNIDNVVEESQSLDGVNKVIKCDAKTNIKVIFANSEGCKLKPAKLNHLWAPRAEVPPKFTYNSEHKVIK